MDERDLLYFTPEEITANGIEHFLTPGCGPDGWGFLIITDERFENVTVTFSVREITTEGEHTPGGPDSFGTEPYLSTYMKWDSCMHVYFKEIGEDGYLHLCGVDAFKAHCALLRRLYVKAFEVMGREPQDGEEWQATPEVG